MPLPHPPWLCEMLAQHNAKHLLLPAANQHRAQNMKLCTVAVSLLPGIIYEGPLTPFTRAELFCGICQAAHTMLTPFAFSPLSSLTRHCEWSLAYAAEICLGAACRG